MAKNGKIGLRTATIVGMNAMIGSGIFTAPATMAAYVGPAGILAYFFVVFAVWCMSLSLSRLAAYFPQEGSFYTYTRQWGGHTMGLIASGLYLGGLMIAMGLITRILGFYLHSAIPTVPVTTLGFTTLIVLVVLNMFGAKLSQAGQYLLIICTLFPLVATILLCLTKFNISNLTPFAPYGFGNILKATRIVIFGFFGFECAASLFNIIEDPEKNVPRALTYSIMIVGIIYSLYIASLIASTPLIYFTSPTIPISDVLLQVFPNYSWIVNMIFFAILSAMLGTVHSMIWSSAALFNSLLKKISPKAALFANKTGLPGSVFIIGALITCTFLTLHNIDLFFCLTAIGIVSAYGLSMITLLTMKKEWSSGRNIVTIFGLATAALILFFAGQGVIEQFIAALQ